MASKVAKRLMLIRHGQTDYNLRKQVQGKGINSELTQIGKDQAHALALRLKSEPIDFLASSSLTRAIQTAQIIGQYHQHLEHHQFPELEEMHYGNWEGRFYGVGQSDNVHEDLMKIHFSWKNGDTKLKIPGGESPLDVQIRTMNAIQSIISTNMKCGVVVCHGRALKVILTSLLEMGLENMYQIDQNNTAVNIVDWDGSKFSAERLNCTVHLPEFLKSVD